jgi:hypothetical protein
VKAGGVLAGTGTAGGRVVEVDVVAVSPPGPGGRVAQAVGLMIVSWFEVTSPVAPLPASNRPVTVVPVAPTRLMDAEARMVPTKVVAEFRVAVRPTVQ